jgi:hypothetical protein
MTSINKPAAQWTDEELLAWARGEASPSGQASNRTVSRECIARFGFENTDDIDSVKAFVIAKFVVEGDETTDEEPSLEPQPNEGGEGSDEAGDATETTETTTPVVEAAPTPVAPATVAPEAPAADEESGEPEMPEENVLVKPTPVTFNQANMSREIIENNLADYAKTMAPNVPTSAETAATKQLMLYRTIQIVLRSTGGDFTQNLNLLLDFIAAHRQTLFAEIRAFRSMDIVRLPANERKNFERLLNLFIGTAVRETRALALKQVDLTRTVEGLDAGAQQRVIEFYSI